MRLEPTPSWVVPCFQRLCDLIKNGKEYPDAEFQVSEEFSLSDTQLARVRRCYDEHVPGDLPIRP